MESKGCPCDSLEIVPDGKIPVFFFFGGGQFHGGGSVLYFSNPPALRCVVYQRVHCRERAFVFQVKMIFFVLPAFQMKCSVVYVVLWREGCVGRDHFFNEHLNVSSHLCCALYSSRNGRWHRDSVLKRR